jgi:hypothetical protein
VRRGYDEVVQVPREVMQGTARRRGSDPQHLRGRPTPVGFRNR